MRRKADRIISNTLKKVPGDWCIDCKANCEFKKYPKWDSNSPKGSFEGYEEVLKNTNIVTTKLIKLIETIFEFQ